MKNHFSDNIKISAILPNYNSVEFLSRAIQSLLDQTEAFTEILIVDDGSTDDSLSVIREFMRSHSIIRLLRHEKNQGVCKALNYGIEQATGDYIILCAADDWYHEQIVALAKKIIRNHPSVGLICGDAIVNRYDKNVSFRRMLPYARKNAFISAAEFTTLSRNSYVGFNGGGGMFMNRQAVLAAGMLHSKLRWHCDWLLYFVVAFQQGLYYCDEIFVYVNLRKGSYSEGRNIWKQQKQVMLDTVQILSQHYPALWGAFKAAALLPSYAIRYIPLFLFYPMLRRFFTIKLLWKLLLNNKMVVRIGRLFPYWIILGVRKLLRA